MKKSLKASVLLALVLCSGGVRAVNADATPGAAGVVNPARPADFRSAKWLLSREVVNTNDESIAKVSDLILDRGSGRIQHVILESGATMGMGGRLVAVPYSAFGWEGGTGRDRFILSMTPERLKTYPEYTAQSWSVIGESKAENTIALRKAIEADAAPMNDPYVGSLESGRKVRVEGEVVRVERVNTSAFGEEVVADVRTSDGAIHRLAMGPSWYVNSSPSAPMRGDRVTVDTLELPRDPERLLVATHLKNGERELHLREATGRPAWAPDTVDSRGRAYASLSSRYLLVSSLLGLRVDCRGQECGRVHDIVIDRASGKVAFMSIDPNENFLGVGDTKRLIPWSVATVSLEGPVRIDASKDMVLASAETPSDITTLSVGPGASGVYDAFNVQPPRFGVRASGAPTMTISMDKTWAAGGDVVSSIEGGSEKTLTGKVIRISTITFSNDVQPARAVTIRTGQNASTDEVVLLGPSLYMDQQKAMFSTDDEISIEACRARVGGHRYWIAKSVGVKSGRVQLWSPRGEPVWSNR